MHRPLLQGGCKRLVGMHESFVADDMSCLVLSYCPGGNLQSLIEQRIFTPAAVAFYASEAVEAIKEIHDLGYVHRCAGGWAGVYMLYVCLCVCEYGLVGVSIFCA